MAAATTAKTSKVKESELKKDSYDTDSDSDDEVDHGNFRGLLAVLELFEQYVPNEADRVMLIDLYRTKQFDLCKQYYHDELSNGKDKIYVIPKVSFTKLSGILNHVSVATYGVDNDGGHIFDFGWSGPKLRCFVTNDSSRKLKKNGSSNLDKLRRSDQRTVGKNGDTDRAFKVRSKSKTQEGSGTIKFKMNGKALKFNVNYSQINGYQVDTDNSTDFDITCDGTDGDAGKDEKMYFTIK